VVVLQVFVHVILLGHLCSQLKPEVVSSVFGRRLSFQLLPHFVHLSFLDSGSLVVGRACLFPAIEVFQVKFPALLAACAK
jgi:hypothetical protein